MKIQFILSLILFFSKIGYSQLPNKSVYANNDNDLTVVLHESGLNKLLAALGEINGTGDYEVMFIKSTYHWTLKNSQINLVKDSAFFETDIAIETGFDTYTDHVKGTMGVFYDKKKNEISVKLLDAVVHLRASILGKSFVFKKIQLTDYIKDAFIFEGPKTISKEMAFALPDGTKKIVDSRIDDVNIILDEKQIKVCSKLKFIEKKEQNPKK